MGSHLTNHCIQEAQSANFGKFEEGNEMFFDHFAAILKDVHGVDFQSKILPQIKTIVKHCTEAVKEQIWSGQENRSYESFQLFGFDFMVDAHFNVFIIEVSGAPACAEKLKDKMADDLVRTCIDPLYPSHIKDDCAEKNLYTLL